ncbi:hypothetical protein C3K04_29915 [Klebsiella pneumoniae subsp. pneumoniae]|nr:hypothetical protein C3K04_29915 [Klebsiella pneumoniae subsp. pneumoniae]
MKASGSTGGGRGILAGLRKAEDGGIPGVAVKCVDIRRNTGGEGGLWTGTDAEARKRGERTGLDTLVVHAVNVGC